MRGWTYDFFLWPLERLWLGALRRELLARAEGRTLELGSGTGLNFEHYPARARVTAIEPDASMRAKSERRAADGSIAVMDGDAQKLEFPDASFDTVAATLVFCSIPDYEAALRQARRVLKPGGRFLLLEHILPPQRPLAAAARLIAPSWAWLAGGCRLDRELAPERFGFRVEDERSFWRGIGRVWTLRRV